MHANFSNTLLRTCGSKEAYEAVCQAFEPRIKDHIDVYGADNDQRLTGLHETQADRQVQLRCLGSWCIDPHSNRNGRKRLEGLVGRSPSSIERRSLHGRQRDHPDGQKSEATCERLRLQFAQIDESLVAICGQAFLFFQQSQLPADEKIGTPLAVNGQRVTDILAVMTQEPSIILSGTDPGLATQYS